MTDPELQAYSAEHLMHELSMLWELAAMLPGRPAGTETAALLESFAIHLRNLIEFFYFSSKGEYVRAQDFFDDSADWPTGAPSDVNRLLERADNQVRHLTVNRLSGNPPEKKWDTAAMLRQIDTVAKKFAATASQKRLHPKVREFLNLPGDQMHVWITKNITHSNVAVQVVTSGNSTLVLGPSDPSTNTIIKW